MTETERERSHEQADDDGMAQTRTAATPQGRASGADELLRALASLTAGGGERDEESLRRFGETAAALRALPGARDVFRAKVASAAGWAALLFSSWRHRKYERPGVSGAARIREIITRDLAEARHVAPVDPVQPPVAPA